MLTRTKECIQDLKKKTLKVNVMSNASNILQVVSIGEVINDSQNSFVAIDVSSPLCRRSSPLDDQPLSGLWLLD